MINIEIYIVHVGAVYFWNSFERDLYDEPTTETNKKKRHQLSE